MIKSIEKFRLHYWVAGIIIPVLITLFTAFVTVRVSTARSDVKIEYIEYDIIELEHNKVSKDIMDVFSAQLDRIEKKLDDHIKDSRN